MKRLMRSLLLAAILSALLCVGALAAESEPVKGGIYDITGSVTLTPDTAATTQTVDGKEYSDYYANAVKFDVKAQNLTENQQYLLLVLKGEGVPTAENIAYIDQAAAQNGSVSFTAYPKELTKGTYHVYLVGGGKTFADSQVASFKCDQKYTLGDVDDSGVITVQDALLTLRHAADLDTLTGTKFLAADVNSSGVVDITDALLILRYAADLIDHF